MVKVQGENGIVLHGVLKIISDEFNVGNKLGLSLLCRAIKTDAVLYEVLNQICYMVGDVDSSKRKEVIMITRKERESFKTPGDLEIGESGYFYYASRKTKYTVEAKSTTKNGCETNLISYKSGGGAKYRITLNRGQALFVSANKNSLINLMKKMRYQML